MATFSIQAVEVSGAARGSVAGLPAEHRPSVVPSVQCRPRSQTQTLKSAFLGPLAPAPSPVRASSGRPAVLQVVAEKAHIEFVRGVKEQTVPEVRLTRSRDGSSGTATFIFEQPSVFEQSTELGDITGLYMVDEEGVMQSVEVSARFINGRPSAIEARYIMRSERDWDRFMRFMERYAEEYGLGFTKK